jgi:hypothetical protein
MYFDDIFDMTELTKARNTLRIKMHPDKLPKISQVETDAATLKYAEMEEEANAKVEQLTSAPPAPKESSTVKALPSTQPPEAPEELMDPELKAKKKAHAKAKIQKTSQMISKVQDTHTKNTAAFLKSQGMFLSAQTVKNGSGAKLVALKAVLAEQKNDLLKLK